jgi:hypothetical protein
VDRLLPVQVLRLTKEHMADMTKMATVTRESSAPTTNVAVSPEIYILDFRLIMVKISLIVSFNNLLLRVPGNNLEE